MLFRLVVFLMLLLLSVYETLAQEVHHSISEKAFLHSIILNDDPPSTMRQPNLANQKTIRQIQFEEFTEGEEFVYDSTVGYQYVSPVDSFPISRQIAGSNIVFSYDLDAQKWVKRDSTLKEINVDGSVIKVISYRWELEDSDWIENSQLEYRYDNQGRNTLFAAYNWDSMFQRWKGDTKTEISYYTNGYKRIIYSWDGSKNNWLEDIKHESIFDPSINTTISTIYIYNSAISEWEVEVKRKTEEIDGENFTIFTVHFESGDEWVLELKREVVYDKFGNEVLSNNYSYDLNNNTWLNNIRVEREAIDSGLYSSEITYWYNYNRKILEPSSKVYWDYDEKRRLVHHAAYSWLSEKQDWIGNINWEVFYKEDKRELDIDYKWNEEIAGWEVNTKRFYYYHKEIIAGLNATFEEQHITLYPNPVINDEITIKLEIEKIRKVMISSVDGKLLKSIIVSDTSSVRLPFNYPAGIYFVKISTDTGIKTFKVFK